MESASKRSTLAAALVFIFWAASAPAQSYPARSVRVIVPYAPGGGADFVTRVYAKAWSDGVGQQFFVDNRAGANGNIGSELAAKSKPDGYTLLSVANTTVTINPSLYRQMPIDMQRDLAPAGTRADVIARLNAETAKAAQLRDVRERLLGEGTEPYTTSASRMGDIIREETVKWARVVKAANITPQ
jgi:tripartite-type tricarboxylate transporter receptor subunit TctC